MLRFVIQRLATSAVVLLAISVLLFGLIHAAPGSPLDMYFDPASFAGTDRAAALRTAQAELGLDKPLPVQYAYWLQNTVTGDLGISTETGRPVLTVMLERLQNSLALMIPSLLIALVLGLLGGVWAAVRRNSAVDYALAGVSLVSLSIPPFFLGLVLIYVFGVTLEWLPTAGMNEPGGGFVSGLRHVIMPASILGLASAAGYLRWTRSSMLDVLDRDHMQTARSKGLSSQRILWRHGAHNALIPIVTVVAMSIPQLFGGAVIVEQIFSWPGMGRLALSAITTRDYPVLMGFVMFIAVLVVLCNLLADLLYAVIDPRIRV